MQLTSRESKRSQHANNGSNEAAPQSTRVNVAKEQSQTYKGATSLKEMLAELMSI